jgi:hypothetical protein
MFACSCLLCSVDSGLCDELITLSEESYRVCVCLILCDLEKSTLRCPMIDLGCCPTEIKGDLSQRPGW